MESISAFLKKPLAIIVPLALCQCWLNFNLPTMITNNKTYHQSNCCRGHHSNRHHNCGGCICDLNCPRLFCSFLVIFQPSQHTLARLFAPERLFKQPPDFQQSKRLQTILQQIQSHITKSTSTCEHYASVCHKRIDGTVQLVLACPRVMSRITSTPTGLPSSHYIPLP
ncbi:hypothetical protein PILCRDRAFT_673132 [Piloderma croceum F 1598]|uniref:Uncharacterized protein n=1 Tax=Piloderma croceum (strain F 1598) TaxID=765440 RepID=A0A0C3ESF2_PILCF|nr:hypothetical protein PILCRDRAFT_673132 [Piloderma croceum F 1598]